MRFVPPRQLTNKILDRRRSPGRGNGQKFSWATTISLCVMRLVITKNSFVRLHTAQWWVSSFRILEAKRRSEIIVLMKTSRENSCSYLQWVLRYWILMGLNSKSVGLTYLRIIIRISITKTRKVGRLLVHGKRSWSYSHWWEMERPVSQSWSSR